MAPEFALFLSPDGIALAHRQPAGHWAVLADTALDVPDLPAALAAMRQRGEDRAGPGFATLVILPDDQILFTSLTAPGPDQEDRLEQIHAGLDGLTPYGISDLAYDFVPLEDGRVKLAAVARETLAEAEGFARENGFEPAGFAARPLDNRYPGVAHFDRSPDWTTSIADIEFGHDSWRKSNPKAENAPEAAPGAEDSVADAVAAEAASTGDTPSDDAPDLETDGATAAATGDKAETVTAPEIDAPVEAGPAETSASDLAPEGQGDEGPEDTPPPKLTKPPAGLGEENETSIVEGYAPIAEPGNAKTSPAAAAIAASEPPETEKEAAAPGPDEPLQMPPGFGAGRARDATPETAAERVSSRPSRLDMGATVAAPAQPRFGRGIANPGAAAPDATPKRPVAAGPAPDLPPLTRTKLRAQRKAQGNGDLAPPQRPALAHAPDPVQPFPDGAERPAGSGRFSGMGKRLSAGAEKARETASGLSARRKPDTVAASHEAPRSTGVGSITARLKTLGRKAQPSELGAADTPKAAAPDTGTARQPAAARIAPDDIPPPSPPPARKKPRLPAPKRARATPVSASVSSADATLTGGLLGRGKFPDRRGPSLRAGLVMTLILLAVLGLIAIWAVFYLPDTALARWLGMERQEPGIEQVDSAPQISDTPQLSATPPDITDTGPDVASLTPEATAPQLTGTPPQAPDLLPDIDADLDLGPAPVAVPRVDPETLLPSVAEAENFYALTGIWQRPPVIDLPTPETELGEVFLAGLDPPVASIDAYALPVPRFDAAADLPRRQSSPVDPETNFVLDDNGLVVPSPEGTLNPDGILIFAGAPVVTPSQRPGDAPAIIAAAAAVDETAAADPTAGAIDTALLGTRRPTGRPADLQEQRERVLLGGITFSELGQIRPEGRPASVQELAAAEAEAAHDAADADAEAVEITSTSEFAIAVSFVPRARPGNIDEIVETARAAGASGASEAVASTEGGDDDLAPVAASVSDTVEPEIPSSATVARAATRENAINLHRINLIGVTGSDSDRRALVRLPSGRFVTVGSGDRLDGGRVAAVGNRSLQYVKSGRTITLEIPAG
jgi:hypothetical protein